MASFVNFLLTRVDSAEHDTPKLRQGKEPDLTCELLSPRYLLNSPYPHLPSIDRGKLPE